MMKVMSAVIICPIFFSIIKLSSVLIDWIVKH